MTQKLFKMFCLSTLLLTADLSFAASSNDIDKVYAPPIVTASAQAYLDKNVSGSGYEEQAAAIEAHRSQLRKAQEEEDAGEKMIKEIFSLIEGVMYTTKTMTINGVPIRNIGTPIVNGDQAQEFSSGLAQLATSETPTLSPDELTVINQYLSHCGKRCYSSLNQGDWSLMISKNLEQVKFIAFTSEDPILVRHDGDLYLCFQYLGVYEDAQDPRIESAYFHGSKNRTDEDSQGRSVSCCESQTTTLKTQGLFGTYEKGHFQNKVANKAITFLPGSPILHAPASDNA